jgi:hypothetical protein
MSNRHACFLCNFTREADHVVILDPACPNCGGQLRLEPAPEPDATPARLSTLAGARWFERGLVMLVVLPLLLAAAKIGWSAAGPAAAAGALGLSVLVTYVALAPATRHR